MSKYQPSSKGSFTVGKLGGTVVAAGARYLPHLRELRLPTLSETSGTP